MSTGFEGFGPLEVIEYSFSTFSFLFSYFLLKISLIGTEFLSSWYQSVDLVHNKKLGISDLKSFAIAPGDSSQQNKLLWAWSNSTDQHIAEMQEFSANLSWQVAALSMTVNNGWNDQTLGLVNSRNHHDHDDGSDHNICPLNHNDWQGGFYGDQYYPCMKVKFPRWEGGDLIGWILHAVKFFCYHWTPAESKMEIALISIQGDTI